MLEPPPSVTFSHYGSMSNYRIKVLSQKQLLSYRMSVSAKSVALAARLSCLITTIYVLTYTFTIPLLSGAITCALSAMFVERVIYWHFQYVDLMRREELTRQDKNAYTIALVCWFMSTLAFFISYVCVISWSELDEATEIIAWCTTGYLIVETALPALVISILRIYQIDF
jgi:hypothetical protein